MFKKLRDLLSTAEDENSINIEGIFAALLVRAAKIDHEYTKQEQLEIESVIKNEFKVLDTEATKLRILGEQIEETTTDTVQLTREIKKEIPFEERKKLAENLWSIILADKFRSDEENSFMRTCIKLIGLSDVDSAMARNTVINRQETN